MFKYRDNVVCLRHSNQQQTIETHQTACKKNTKIQTLKVTKPSTKKIQLLLHTEYQKCPEVLRLHGILVFGLFSIRHNVSGCPSVSRFFCVVCGRCSFIFQRGEEKNEVLKVGKRHTL